MSRLLLPAVAAALAAVVAASAEPVAHNVQPPAAGPAPGESIVPIKGLQTNLSRLEHHVGALQSSTGKTTSP
jgi:hypothetical protein